MEQNLESPAISKANSLAEKMNKLTEKFCENLDTADELQLTGDDIIDCVTETTQDIKLYSDDRSISEIINLENMIEDFKYVRETLRENTDNGRRVLNSITLELLDSTEDKKAGLIMSFAELNRAVTDNIRLYILSYKEISKIILNLDKIRKEIPSHEEQNQSKEKEKFNNAKIISTADLIKELNNTK